MSLLSWSIIGGKVKLGWFPRYWWWHHKFHQELWFTAWTSLEDREIMDQEVWSASYSAALQVGCGIFLWLSSRQIVATHSCVVPSVFSSSPRRLKRCDRDAEIWTSIKRTIVKLKTSHFETGGIWFCMQSLLSVKPVFCHSFRSLPKQSSEGNLIRYDFYIVC